SYYSVLVDTDLDGAFPAEFYNVPITARAYVKYEDGTYKYSEETVTRSIGYVAAMHYLSGKANDTQGIVAKIANGATKEILLEDEDLLAGGESVNTAIMVGGIEAVGFEGLSVVWTVAGDAVQVDAQTGVVTPVKGGTATVQAVVSVQGGNSVTLTKEVTVDVATTTVEEDYFAIKQTNEQGAVITNDYTYELSNASVSSVSFADDNVLTDSEYAVEGNTLTVYGAAFADVVGGSAQTLTVETATENVEITFGKVATFAITKASDMNPQDSSVIAAWQAANGMAWTSNPSTVGALFGGYTVLANDIDFEGATISQKVACANAYGGVAYGFNGTFDGMNHTLKNFVVSGTNVSLFGRSDFGAAFKDMQILNYRSVGTASFGLFDSECYGALSNLTIDGTLDATANGGCLVGKFATHEVQGATMNNCTITARVGAATESAGIVVGGSFITVKNSTINTAYNVPTTFTSAGGTVNKLAPADYYAYKVNGDTVDTVTTNDYVKAIAGDTLTSVTYSGRNGVVDLTSKATLSGGNVVIPASEFVNLTGRGVTIKVATNEETEYFYQDIATYAITKADDMTEMTWTTDLAEFVQAEKTSTGYAGYIILANDVDCTGVRIRTMAPCSDMGTGSFSGTFDGRGYTVSNVEQYTNNSSWSQFFGTLSSSAVVKNVSFVNYTFTGYITSGLFAKYSEGTVDNVFIDAVASAYNGSATAGATIGAFSKSARVTNCTFIVRNNPSATGTTWTVMLYSGADFDLTNWRNVAVYTDYDMSTWKAFGASTDKLAIYALTGSIYDNA
ncbi:MAG: hypothetical protein J6U60_01085, partial [Clostridia bacterium]|nr:hypothetical protein [Clostridia bacterium]